MDIGIPKVLSGDSSLVSMFYHHRYYYLWCRYHRPWKLGWVSFQHPVHVTSFFLQTPSSIGFYAFRHYHLSLLLCLLPWDPPHLRLASLPHCLLVTHPWHLLAHWLLWSRIVLSTSATTSAVLTLIFILPITGLCQIWHLTPMTSSPTVLQLCGTSSVPRTQQIPPHSRAVCTTLHHAIVLILALKFAFLA